MTLHDIPKMSQIGVKFEFIGSYISPINSVITDEEVWPKTCYEGKENEV